ncbi:MAG: MBL fold metallo-hydrolase [Bryobacteraceae bacterium]
MTVLVDNRAKTSGLSAEHGFSALLETGSSRILFDTGQGGVLEANAAVLGERLDMLDAVVLSHGHYDHTGGLPTLLARAPSARVYLHPAAAEPKFARGLSPPHRAIGMPAGSRTALLEAGSRVCWNTGAVEVAAGVMATGEIPRSRPETAGGGRFFLDAACRVPDPFADEQALVIRTRHGLVVITGCAHAGLPATLNWCEALGGGQSVCAVFGGFHLAGATDAELESAARALESSGVEMIGACHCTGARGRDFLRIRFPGRVLDAGCGMVWEWP